MTIDGDSVWSPISGEADQKRAQIWHYKNMIIIYNKDIAFCSKFMNIVSGSIWHPNSGEADKKLGQLW